MADGAETNWTIQKRWFSDFVAILDFIHALSYVFAAAMAGRGFAAGWEVYVRWIGWVWQGQVAKVIQELEQRQAELGMPAGEESESSPKQVVADALGYLRNNQHRMRYDDYRRLGLPITSSHVESTVKQFNRRVKGTEKFWSEPGAETLLQLRADYLSETEPMEKFWEERQEKATGRRLYRRAIRFRELQSRTCTRCVAKTHHPVSERRESARGRCVVASSTHPTRLRFRDKRTLPLASGRRRKDAFLDESLAKVDAVLEIDLQGDDSGSSVRCSAYQHRTVPTKMPRPLVTAGIEQRHDLPCPGINPGDIRPFVAVARKTGQAKIICSSLTQVMFGDDVIDLEW